MPAAEELLLRACACFPPAPDPDRLAVLAADVADWNRFVAAAEEHGIVRQPCTHTA